MSHKLSRTLASLLLALAIAFAGVTPAAAQPPTNDDFDNAALIPALPFSEALSLSEATIAADDPLPSCNDLLTPSVWYAFTPTTNMTVEAHTSSWDFTPVVSLFTGSRGDLTEIGCNYYEPSLTLSLTGGITYYFLITSLWETGSDLTLSVTEVVPPLNDDFDAATVISVLPFTATTNTRLATADPDDPPYGGGYWGENRTVWYSFTPTEVVMIDIDTSGSSYYTLLDVFTGSREDLTEIAFGSERVVFIATPPTTYYFMILGESTGNLTLSVQEYVPQPLVPGFWWYPGDPSVFDTIEFCDDTYDPDQLVSPTSFAWDFGDGISSEENCAYHQYTADGDYEVHHTAQTDDGRSASISQVVQVRTHDVAITKIIAPVAARAGQVRPITVSVKSWIYDETVSVDLYKRGPEGDEWIGYSSQFVPVRPGNRTTAFTFKYTFTDSDAMIGEVTFYAVANIPDKRDAFPENNEAVASTKLPR